MKKYFSNSSLNIFLMRHAEPVTYGYSTSGLNREGLLQISHVAKNYIDIFSDGKPHRIKIIYSSRKRTRESAINLYEEVKKLLQANKIKNIYFSKPQPERILQTADAINGIIQLGFPLEDALMEWSRQPEDYLKRFNIQTPGEIVKIFINYFRNENPEYTELIAITHETALMAFQKKYFINFKTRPGYTEIMQLFLTNNPNSIKIKYKGEEVNIND